MQSKESIYQKICKYTNKEFDPNTDNDVLELLRNKFNIYLPQRSSLDDSLSSTASDHEIVNLILQYRILSK
jgi:DNA polymerase I-like protein with 3'-5' exonuclease and polymerase domains